MHYLLSKHAPILIDLLEDITRFISLDQHYFTVEVCNFTEIQSQCWGLTVCTYNSSVHIGAAKLLFPV